MKKDFRLIHKNQKISTQFSLITTMLIAITSLLMAMSVLSFFNQILKDTNIQNHKTDLTIAADIFVKIKTTFDGANVEILDTKIDSFVGNLMHCIVEYGKKESKGVDSGLTLYKGMELNIVELLEYLKNRNYNITFPYFFTMSDKKEFAEFTSKRNKSPIFISKMFACSKYGINVNHWLKFSTKMLFCKDVNYFKLSGETYEN